jgi:alkanesulfonate monooxygenase SsuD/methylene tetrahydromethanopterin reductase-like flavin-dependent oxidoreductase (luciferase family)
MKLGVLTLVDHYPDAMSATERYAQIVDEAVYAEELGFDSFWIGEHHFSQYICPYPVPLLAAIASRTSKIRLGTGVALAPHHDPIRLAEDYAMLDVLSGGRVDLVLARGAFKAGFDGFNQSMRESKPRLRESAQIIKGAWAESPFSYDGEFRKVDNVDVQPRPVQSQGPPIWIGSTNVDSARWIADQCMHLSVANIFGPAVPMAPAVNAYREQLKENGENPSEYHVSSGHHVYIGESSSQAHAEFDPHYRAYCKLIVGELTKGLSEKQLEQAKAAGAPVDADSLFKRLVRNAVIFGADEAADHINALKTELALDHYWGYFDLGGIDTPTLRTSMERFASKVMHQVR